MPAHPRVNLSAHGIFSYSPAPEILEYFKGLAKKYELYRFIRLSHKVVGADWVASEGIWKIKVQNLETDEVIEDWCHFMISASGILKSVLASTRTARWADRMTQQLEMARYPWVTFLQGRAHA